MQYNLFSKVIPSAATPTSLPHAHDLEWLTPSSSTSTAHRGHRPDLVGAPQPAAARARPEPTPSSCCAPRSPMAFVACWAWVSGLTPDAAGYAPLAARSSFITTPLCVETRLFEGHGCAAPQPGRAGILGVVTNKAERLAHPIIDALGLSGRCACVVAVTRCPAQALSRPCCTPAPVLASSRRSLRRRRYP